MYSWRAIIHRVQALFRRQSIEADMAAELEGHIDELTERNIAAGMAPDEARYAARREFGGVEQIKERARDERHWRWAEELSQDLRYAIRQLIKAPGFAVVAILSLAFGIGVNTANFSLIDQLWLTPLPVKDPEALVLFQYVAGPHGSTMRSVYGDFFAGQTLPLATYQRARDQPALLQDVIAFAGLWTATVEIDRQSESLRLGQVVSGNYYQALGVGAALGRVLEPSDDRLGAPAVAVLSYAYWQARFSGSDSVIGRTIFVNRAPVTIIGVSRRGFVGTAVGAGSIDVTLPLSLAPRVRADGPDVLKPSHNWIHVMGRLNAGITREQARAGLEASFQASLSEALADPNDAPKLRLDQAGLGRTAGELEQSRGFIRIVTGIVGLVLLAACANVANLLLARAAGRRREIAMRLALGASRGRVVRQLVTESVLLAVLGAAAGLLAARWSLDLIDGNLVLDWRVLGFTGGLAGLTGIIFGLAPAVRATRVDLATEFQGGGRTVGSASSRVRAVLLTAQVAISFVLLAGAGLLIQSVRQLRAVDTGFNWHRLLLFSVDVEAGGYRNAAVVAPLQSLTERIAAIPGVQSVAFSAWPLLSNSGGWHRAFKSASQPKNTPMTVNTVSPGFFSAMQIPLLAGRTFDEHDNANSSPVIVVNEQFARTYFSRPQAVGEHIRFDGRDCEIVGVVQNVKAKNLRQEVEPLVFIPFLQQNFGRANFAVRLAGTAHVEASAIRQAAAALDRNLVIADVRMQDEVVENNVLGDERFFARVSLSFGALALVLASVGLYGLFSYTVLQRTSEIGVRMALGALPSEIRWLILRESVVLLGLGLAIGFLAFLGASRAIASLLYGVSPVDVLTHGTVGLLLVAVGLIAAWLPARRASLVDPMAALRTE
jgi:predicted permease